MAEAFHEHLNHLSWWEQIDRLFNPSKYSCSTIGNDNVVHLVWIMIFVVLFCCLAILVIDRWLRKN